MLIHTASFFDQPTGVVLSIARSQPKGFDLKSLRSVEPAWALLNDYKAGKITDDEYTRVYIKSLNPYLFIRDLFDTIGEDCKEVTLCCWEKTGEFCHRHILATIIRELDGPYNLQMGEEK